MLTFLPASLRGIGIDLGRLAAVDDGLSAQLASNVAAYDPAAGEHPFVQLRYDEIGEGDLDRMLGYAGIATANRPLGLPYDFSPITAPGSDGDDWRLYPLSGLLVHVRSAEPAAFEMRDQYGSLDALFRSLENDGHDVTAGQYLALTLAEAIGFCHNRGLGLATHW